MSTDLVEEGTELDNCLLYRIYDQRTIYYIAPYDGYLAFYCHRDSSFWGSGPVFKIAIIGGNSNSESNSDNYLSLIMQTVAGSSTLPNNSLRLLHYSDIHGDDEAVTSILNYA